MLRCPRCNGNLLTDNHRELFCILCSRRFRPAMIAPKLAQKGAA